MKPICILAVMGIMLVLVSGCTTANSHERYTQVTVTEKFYERYPMFGVNPELVSNPAWYHYDYYIRYTTGGNPHVDRVSKDVYATIFENKTYVLRWGYVNDMTSDNDEYGYTEVVSQVAGMQP